MSLKCSAAVWESRLPTPLKMTALALANFADDDGGSIRPSVETLARMTGQTVRQERNNLTALCARKVLVPETPRTGGRTPTRYRMDLNTLKSTDPGNNVPTSPEMGFPGQAAKSAALPRNCSSPYVGNGLSALPGHSRH